MSEVPSCPECGAPMRLRVARRGLNAGSSFWGCSRYPSCKGLVAAGPRPPQPTGPDRRAAPEPEDLPHIVELSDPAASDYQVRYVQAVGLPQADVTAIHEAGIPHRLRRMAGQWRLDAPLPRDPFLAPSSVVAVLEAILTRGSLTYCDPSIEMALPSPSVERRTADALEATLHALAALPTAPLPPEPRTPWEQEFVVWFEEEQFARRGWTLHCGLTVRSVSAEGPHIESVELPIVLSHPSIDRLTVVAPEDASNLALIEQWAQSRLVEVIVLPQAGDPRLVLSRLAELMHRVNPPSGDLPIWRLSRYAHQVQIVLLEAYRGGFFPTGAPWSVRIEPPTMLERIATPDEIGTVLHAAAEGFAELVERIARLHGIELPRPVIDIALAGESKATSRPHIVIRSGPTTAAAAAPAFLIRDAPLGLNITQPVANTDPVRCPDPQRSDAEWLLHYIYRKPSFWEGQWETIRRTLRGLDSLVLLPTGGGKTIAFQLSAFILPGVAIVVDPIIALIEDQIDNLHRAGIDRVVGITSQIVSQQQREALVHALASGYYLFCYVAPERFQIESFRAALRQLTTIAPVSLVAIDEAHCVSEWGHDFRTAYLNLGRNARSLCAKGLLVPPLVGLTGTASHIVLRDVQRDLEIHDFDAIITPESFDRPEIQFDVVTCDSSNKIDRIVGLINSLPSRFGISKQSFFKPRGSRSSCGIVFTPFVRGNHGVEVVAKNLHEKTGIEVVSYAGSMNSAIKGSSARKFKNNEAVVMVATKAYGMGIDKPNIRWVIHESIPPSIESYYQEAGRAGRDKQPAMAFLVLSNDRARENRRLLDPSTDVHTLDAALKQRRSDGTDDDISRALWFHSQAFRGREDDLATIEHLLKFLQPDGNQRSTNVPWVVADTGFAQRRDTSNLDEAQRTTEKALHRLVVVGVVSDYTVDYANQQFVVRLAEAENSELSRRTLAYIGEYQAGLIRQYRHQLADLDGIPFAEAALRCARLLVEFIYEHIERARRRSLAEMLEAASAGSGEKLRERILNYLASTEFDERLERLLSGATAAEQLIEYQELLQDLVSPKAAERLRGAVARFLTSYPDVPPLLMLRAATEALATEPDYSQVEQNIAAAVRFGRERFSYESSDLIELAEPALRTVSRDSRSAKPFAEGVVVALAGDRDAMRTLATRLPALCGPAACKALYLRLADRTANLFVKEAAK